MHLSRDDKPVIRFAFLLSLIFCILRWAGAWDMSQTWALSPLWILGILLWMDSLSD